MIKKINKIYKIAKVVKWLSLITIFIPPVFLVAAPMAIFYWLQRRRLLLELNQTEVEAISLSLSDSKEKTISDKITYIRKSRWILFAPFIFILVDVALLSLLFSFFKPIDIVDLREAEFVAYSLDHQSDEPKIKTKVTFDKDNNIVINIDGIMSDEAACRALFENLRQETTEYIQKCFRRCKSREAQPFIINAKNRTITIP